MCRTRDKTFLLGATPSEVRTVNFGVSKDKFVFRWGDKSFEHVAVGARNCLPYICCNSGDVQQFVVTFNSQFDFEQSQNEPSVTVPAEKKEAEEPLKDEAEEEPLKDEADKIDEDEEENGPHEGLEEESEAEEEDTSDSTRTASGGV